jgi:hypothetical protein
MAVQKGGPEPVCEALGGQTYVDDLSRGFSDAERCVRVMGLSSIRTTAPAGWVCA